MTTKIKKNIILGVLLLLIIILIGYGCQKAVQNKNQGAINQKIIEPVIYKDEDKKFEFSRNPEWEVTSINTGEQHETSNPYLIIKSGETSEGLCDEKGCAINPGDRETLTKGDTFETDPLLNPWFKVLKVQGNKWVSLQVIDGEKKCIAEAACQQFLSSISLEKKEKMEGADYKTYNDFLDLVSTLKVIE